MRTPRYFSDAEILRARPPRNAVDPDRPYAFLVEPECSATGEVVEVATLFLTNRECPFRCLMCDLWKNTTVESIPAGSIPRQIDSALESLSNGSARPRQIKLYNSGNFFDGKAIPFEDHPAIAERVRSFDRVIVENHPKLCSPRVVEFRDLIRPARLEVALGLETVHPEVLPALNKGMTLDDFAAAVRFLRGSDIDVRAFVLLRPPFLSESEGVEWAVRSIDYAFSLGVGCCSVIPTRGGNGLLERLAAEGDFETPTLASMEAVLEEGLRRNRGRVFIDLWDLERFAPCPLCRPLRAERLQQMNLTQTLVAPIDCSCRREAG